MPVFLPHGLVSNKLALFVPTLQAAKGRCVRPAGGRFSRVLTGWAWSGAARILRRGSAATGHVPPHWPAGAFRRRVPVRSPVPASRADEASSGPFPAHQAERAVPAWTISL